MRRKLEPMLFDDEHFDEASAAPASPVFEGIRSTRAKDASEAAEDGPPLHSVRTRLDDRRTLAYDVAHTRLHPEAKIVITTRPTPLRTKAFHLL